MTVVYEKVQDSPGLLRDVSSRAILNADSSAIMAYKRQRSHQHNINEALSDINTLKSEMSEIKGLLMQLLQNKGIV